jgi:uncharacterized membrane protein (DUF4010 family)
VRELQRSEPRHVNESIVVRLGVAALAGLAVGLEREWSGHAVGPQSRFAGLRTFFLLGIVGGVAGWFSSSGEGGAVALGVALLAGAAALVVTAYFLAVRTAGASVEATTEVAALAVLAVSALAGSGYLVVASGTTALMVLALSEKQRLQALVARIGATELRAALQFAVLALVILPLLPNTSYGPLGGVQPRALWTVVLVFLALNFAGYLARKTVGADRGYGVTGILGGVISSTAVSFQFSRLSRGEPALITGLAIGVVGACTVLIPRVVFLSAVLNRAVAVALLPLVLPAFLLGAVLTAAALWRQNRPATTLAEPGDQSPLRFWSAIRMAIAFQLALMAIAFVRDTLGTTGVLASAALLGLTDMDALTLSMNRLGSTPDLIHLGARAIAVGIIANSLLKLGLVLGLGAPAFRVRAGAGLALLTAASAITLWLLW